ncbi:flagellar basal body P-ring formation protein FlgA [Halomonas denitrificans]|uniref:flagellar basal body P-ring formation chaperone FlgA n=1 Tax=Halomonas denitrificans TaxID=370769 RepID=UPI001CD366B7|nr:flagellar basal body P-ring formation chaperone FlgA [Halomonas denitrificans]MCA0974304.1 flagellar basal body P-ring formation protein FlgA [Halomonas denitrificans]
MPQRSQRLDTLSLLDTQRRSSLAPLARLLLVIFLLATSLLTIACTAQAADEPQHTALLDRVEGFLFEQALTDGASPQDLQIEVFAPAADLTDCQAAEPFLPRAGTRLAGRVSVGLRCAGETHRTRYLQADITRMGWQLVAARDIAPGERLSDDMLSRERVDLARLSSQALNDPASAIGQVARRGIRQGQALASHQLSAPKLVRRGEQVAVEASGRGFRISRQGEALEAGGMGDRVRVRVDRRQVLEARVVDRGRLAVAF